MLKLIILAFLILASSCGSKEDVNVVPSAGSVQPHSILPLLSYDIDSFIGLFSNQNFVIDTLVWEYGLDKVEFKSRNLLNIKSLTLLNSGPLSKADLERDFNSLGYYLNKARINHVYNNIPVDGAIVELAKDFLDGKYKHQEIVGESTYFRLNTISELLRVITVLNPKDILNPKVIQSYPNLDLDKIRGIVLKSHFLEIRKVFSKFHDGLGKHDYAPAACARYRAVAPIMKIDPQWTDEVEILKSIAIEFHKLLDDPSQVYGGLSTHLSCLEVLEEVLGRNPDPKTGEGLTERYIKFIAKYLWDYPFYGKVCAPLGGVLSFIHWNKNSPVSMCDSNFKSLYDNLLLRHIMDTYLAGAQIFTSDFAPKLVDVNVANFKSEELLKELRAMKQVKPSPAISPSMSPSLKASPIGKKKGK